MGTYTTNYNLFLPSIGEQGWGDLVNGNFSTIDTTMKSLRTAIGALEPLSVIQVDSNNNVTFPANVNIEGTINGAVNSLTKTVIVSASTTKFYDALYIYLEAGSITVCPYVPGVLYTGFVKSKVAENQYPNKMYVLSSSDTWSIVDMNSTSESDYSFTNAKTVVVTLATYNNSDDYIYLPIYL